MKQRILIVDAYNMIGNWPELDKLKKADRLEDARDLLLKILSSYHKQIDWKLLLFLMQCMCLDFLKAMISIICILSGQMKDKRQTVILNP